MVLDCAKSLIRTPLYSLILSFLDTWSFMVFCFAVCMGYIYNSVLSKVKKNLNYLCEGGFVPTT